MRLGFNSKTLNFILTSGMEPDDPNWINFKPFKYRTPNVKTAAQFIRYANKSAKEQFKKSRPTLYLLPKDFALPSILDAHQIEGIKWALTRKYSYLSHAPGAGKTAQAIFISELADANGQVIVIAPPSLLINWEREIDKFTTEFRTVSIVGASDKQDRVAWNADYIIVPHSMIHKDWVLSGILQTKIKTLIVDEASAFKELNTIRSQTLYTKILSRNIKHVVFLDGSPAPNRAMELYAPLINLSPESIGYMSEFEFGRLYGAGKQGFRGKWEFKGWSREEELQRLLHKFLFHTVTEDKLSHAERKRMIVYISSKILPPKVWAWESKVIKQLKLSDISENASKGKIAEWRQQMGLMKVKPALTYIRECLSKGESLLVFAWHREVIEKLSRGMKTTNHGVVMGGTKSSIREKLFKRFNDGKLKLIFGNISAMARGHNLQRADRIIFVEYSWSDEVNKQCEKRASRKGRDVSKPVKSSYLVVADSLDEVVMNSVRRRERAIKKVIR